MTTRQKHTGLRPIDLVDPMASLVHWVNPIGDLAVYDPNGGKDTGIWANDGVLWNAFIDPDGS